MSDTPTPAPTPRRRPRRDPAPRDWRFWVGGTGRVLLAIGVLMFGFVAYQLWGTGIEYEQHQNSLEREFENRLSELATAPTIATTASTVSPTSSGPGTIPPTSASAATPTSTTGPSGTGPASTTSSSTKPSTTEPVSTDSTVPEPTSPPQIVEWPIVRKGDVLAVVEIPSIKKRIYAVAGIDTKNLKRGLGHYPGTPMPGEYGNSAFAGHRTTFGAPLLNVDKLVPGDEIIVTTITNGRYVYIVSEPPRIVSPRDGSVVTTTDTSVATLTLTSCHPKYSAKQRIIISATLDESRSSAVQFPTRNVDPPSREDVDAMTNVDSEVEPDENSTDDPVVDSTLADVTTDTIDDATISDTGGTPVGNVDNSVDGEGDVLTATELAQGWFDDGAAWWHVAGWGLLDLVIIGGAWWLAWFTQRRWLGWVVGAIPFLLVLYFVYQNVNRLLPADL